ncbi:hypothetical protein [Streptacidiphilus sp. P02-A3a]|uniref:hypothetical protein n=1 Tax=Streptacidiphilus sp. P02-A3a TaxID=2704468 RepID=UPI0015FD23C7|nr:hypothetical protein [Streptacidiphilus sp. P02-A3a]QMU68405.1 hypothetical protein GXP74_09380 [Streptacidiphilus sp. P02-A3a]
MNEPDFSFGLPSRIPDPVPDCPECARYVAQHRAARTDPSAAADARVLMRRHLEQQHD